ncbi:hypothetical protein [Ruegeria sp. THAF57]|uniref:hypothetical protein n=1 Tax=Ruegeria sp. THAF57 TaxID=2744555 RepID=UPI0015DD9214|nr:hypothetical protein [Ruegeria sp. THAF57]
MRRSVGAPARRCQAIVRFYLVVLPVGTGIAGGLDGARVRRTGAAGFSASTFCATVFAATLLGAAGFAAARFAGVGFTVAVLAAAGLLTAGFAATGFAVAGFAGAGLLALGFGATGAAATLGAGCATAGLA